MSQNRLNPYKAAAAYRRAGSLRRAAQLLGVGSADTVRRALIAAGVDRSPAGGHWKRGRYLPSQHRSQVADWFRRHPDARMPRRPKDIAFVLGCSQAAVRCYLYRRRRFERNRLQEAIETLRGLRTDRSFTACNGLSYRWTAVRDLSWVFDPWGFKADLRLRLHNGAVVRWLASYDQLKALART